VCRLLWAVAFSGEGCVFLPPNTALYCIVFFLYYWYDVNIWCAEKSTFNEEKCYLYFVLKIFIGGGYGSTQRSPQTCRKSLTNFDHIMLYRLLLDSRSSDDKHWWHRGYSRILHLKNTDYQDITEILLKVTLQKKINNENNLKSRLNCRFWIVNALTKIIAQTCRKSLTNFDHIMLYRLHLDSRSSDDKHWWHR
jgi:hypothetical protein